MQDCYAKALMIIGHLPCFVILNELNTKNSMIASENWTLNATAAARKKFGGGLTGQSTTSTTWKFDSISRRNLMAPGSTCPCKQGSGGFSTKKIFSNLHVCRWNLMHFWPKYDHSTDALFWVQTVWKRVYFKIRPIWLCWVSGDD